MFKISFWFIWKKGYKTILKNKGKTIPILILMTLAIGFSSAMFDVQDDRWKIIDNTLETTKFADGFVYMDPMPLPFILNLSGEEILNKFKYYEMRLILRTEFKIKGEYYDGLLVGIDLTQEKKINILVDENENKIDNINFLMNWDFADSNEIEKGDKVEIKYGSIKKEIEVRKIGFNPEFKYVPLYENVAFPSIKPYPILYIDLNYLNLNFINQTTPLINQLIYRLHSDVDQDDIEEIIEDNLGIYLKELFSQKDHPFIKENREDAQSDRVIFLVLTFVLIISSLITLIVVMNRLIEEDLKSVSIFQGLGANKKEILGSFLTFNIILVGLAIGFGIVLGFLIKIPFTMLVSDLLGVPYNQGTITITYENSLIISLSLFTSAILSTYFIVKKTFKMSVQQTLKYETKYYTKTNFAEKIYLKIKKVPHPFTQYNLRRIFGRKLNLISLLMALSFSTSLLVYFYAFPDSISYSLNRKVNDIEKWDGVANMWQFEQETMLKSIFAKISDVDEYEGGIVDTLLFSKEKKNFTERLRLLAFDKNSKLHDLIIQEGRKFRDESDIIISKDLVRKYGFELNDKIYVKTEGNRPYHVKIVGIVDDLTAESIYVSIDTAQKILNKTGMINTMYFTVDNDIKDTYEKIEDLPFVELVVKKDKVKEDLNSTIETFKSLINFFGVLLGIFGIVLIAIIIKSIIEYRLEDYGNMKAVGLLNSELKKPLRLELLFYFTASLFIGLIIGYIMMMGLMEMYSWNAPGLQLKIYPISYVYFVLNIMFMLVVTYIVNVRKVKKMNIAEIMRSKTFG